MKNGVNLVLHGHAHIFAKQDLAGIVYPEVPQPGNPPRGDPNTVPRTAAEYDYLSGKILGAPGYVRITVAPDKVTTELVRTYLPARESDRQKNRRVDFTYTIPAHTNAGEPLKPSVK